MNVTSNRACCKVESSWHCSSSTFFAASAFRAYNASDFTLPFRILRLDRAGDLRGHPRAPLGLTIRLRWFGALGLVSATAQTLDTSGGGLLARTGSPLRTGSQVWVTLPYEPESPRTGSEFPAKVVHNRVTPEGEHLLGIAFEPSEKPKAITSLEKFEAGARWRRLGSFETRKCRSPRWREREFGVPVTVRRRSRPWPDEVMSANLAPGGVLFTTLQVYEMDSFVAIELPIAAGAPASPRSARIVRMSELEPGEVLQQRRRAIYTDKPYCRWHFAALASSPLDFQAHKWPKLYIAASLFLGRRDRLKGCCGCLRGRIRPSPQWFATRIRSSAALCITRLSIKWHAH